MARTRRPAGYRGVGQVETVPIDTISEHPENTNERDGIDDIRESYRFHGQYAPVLVQRSSGYIVKGNHTHRAMVAEGATLIDAVFRDMDDDTARRIMLIDNPTGRRSRDNPQSLAELLQQLDKSPAGLAGTGYGKDDLSLLMASLSAAQPATPSATDPDVVPETAPKRTRRGDVWELGPHRVMCGDCRNPAHVAQLLAGARLNLAFTSPPYASQRDYDEESGFEPIPEDEYVDWFAPVSENVAAHLESDGSWFVNIKPPGIDLDTHLYVFDLVTTHVRAWGWHYLTEFCWERAGVPKQVVLRFKNQFEPVYQFTRGRPKIRPENVRHLSADAIVPAGPGRGNTSWADPDSAVVSQGQHGDVFEGQRKAKRTGRGDTSWKGRQGTVGAIPGDVTTAGARRRRNPGTPGASASADQGTGKDIGQWLEMGFAYPGNRLPTFAGTHQATGHSAAFPVGLPAWFIRAYTDPGDRVYDPFVGSGSTILAAHQENRIGFGMELSPRYVDIICKRWQENTGVTPRRNGRPVSFISARHTA